MLRRTKMIVLSVLLAVLGLAVVNPTTVIANIEVSDTELISAAPNDEPGNAASNGPAMSPDGRFVAFSSFATNLTPNVQMPAGQEQAFIYDRQLQTMELVSRSTSGEVGDLRSVPTSISSDGRFILFFSSATNLTPDYVNPNPETFLPPSYVYLRDRQTETTVRIGTTLTSIEHTGARISNDGTTIAYTGSDATGSALFIHNRIAVTTTRLIGNFANPKISADGRYVAYRSGPAGNFSGARYDTITGNSVSFATQSNLSIGLALSPDGQYAVYYTRNGISTSSVIVEAIESGQQETLISDTVSTAHGSLSMSADNRFVSFYKAPGPSTTPVQAWVADTATGQKLLVDEGTDKSSNAFMQLSTDGTQLAFSSTHPGDVRQVFVTTLNETDVTPPTISDASFSPNPKAVNAPLVELSAEVMDDVSGVASVEYYDPVQEAWFPMTLNGSDAAATINTPAEQYPASTYEFVVRATDGAGNEATSPVYLYIYSPASNTFGLGSITPGGPTSDPGDNLPALPGSPTGQFTFAVTYGGGASSTPTGTSTFTYGSACILPWSNCFRMTTNSFDWLIANGDTATFQGTASLTLGSQNLGSDFVVRVTATNGTNGAADHYLLQLYEQGANPETATPLYQTSGDVTGFVLVL